MSRVAAKRQIDLQLSCAAVRRHQTPPAGQGGASFRQIDTEETANAKRLAGTERHEAHHPLQPFQARMAASSVTAVARVCMMPRGHIGVRRGRGDRWFSGRGIRIVAVPTSSMVRVDAPRSARIVPMNGCAPPLVGCPRPRLRCARSLWDGGNNCRSRDQTRRPLHGRT